MKILIIIFFTLVVASCSKKKQPVAETPVQEEPVVVEGIKSPGLSEDTPGIDVVPIRPADTNSGLLFAESGPQYPGGDWEMIKFIAKNINYPEKARKEGIQGYVDIQVVIEKDGSVSNPKVFNSLGYGCDEEAIRVVKLLPKWAPAKKDGRRVIAIRTIPVWFRLN